jgi:hypothetical protein
MATMPMANLWADVRRILIPEQLFGLTAARVQVAAPLALRLLALAANDASLESRQMNSWIGLLQCGNPV